MTAVSVTALPSLTADGSSSCAPNLKGAVSRSVQLARGIWLLPGTLQKVRSQHRMQKGVTGQRVGGCNRTGSHLRRQSEEAAGGYHPGCMPVVRLLRYVSLRKAAATTCL
jgi:hypothetical protein